LQLDFHFYFPNLYFLSFVSKWSLLLRESWRRILQNASSHYIKPSNQVFTTSLYIKSSYQVFVSKLRIHPSYQVFLSSLCIKSSYQVCVFIKSSYQVLEWSLYSIITSLHIYSLCWVFVPSVYVKSSYQVILSSHHIKSLYQV